MAIWLKKFIFGLKQLGGLNFWLLEGSSFFHSNRAHVIQSTLIFTCETCVREAVVTIIFSNQLR